MMEIRGRILRLIREANDQGVRIESRQIADQFRVSTRDAQQEILSLEQDGLVETEILGAWGGPPMCAEITPSGRKLIQLPHPPAITSAETGELKPRRLKVFLCYASGDRQDVRELYRRLKRNKNFDPWFDDKNLLPGQDWELEIRKAVRSADVVGVCLSRNSVTKTGYVQKEIRIGLDIAEEHPEGTDLFQEGGYAKLTCALGALKKNLPHDR